MRFSPPQLLLHAREQVAAHYQHRIDNRATHQAEKHPTEAIHPADICVRGHFREQKIDQRTDQQTADHKSNSTDSQSRFQALDGVAGQQGGELAAVQHGDGASKNPDQQRDHFARKTAEYRNNYRDHHNNQQNGINHSDHLLSSNWKNCHLTKATLLLRLVLIKGN